MTSTSLRALLDALPQSGHVTWLARRPARRAPLQIVDWLDLDATGGITGDRYAGRSGKRQVTLIQAEHLSVVAALLGRERVDPAELRRNVVVGGINLLALRDRRFRLGDAVLEGTGACHPCSRMEEALGAGGYNALRGHGGITARVVAGGRVRLGDAVALAGATAAWTPA
ncbi:MAG: MOSC domain-containing protein [Gammaproteobacteria bacterium]